MRPLVISLLLLTSIPAVAEVFPEDNFTLLTSNAYAETPQNEGQVVMQVLKDVPEGSVIEEIDRAAITFGVKPKFMEIVAKIESDYNPKQVTGKYIGLFQLSKAEFSKFGAGDIYKVRDNSVAAANKITTEGIEFKLRTKKIPTQSDLYLIHQQGVEGAAKHIENPDKPAWQNMCATDEGKHKGEKWCKRAIWENTLPFIKEIFKTVDALTSGAFIKMWQEREQLFMEQHK